MIPFIFLTLYFVGAYIVGVSMTAGIAVVQGRVTRHDYCAIVFGSVFWFVILVVTLLAAVRDAATPSERP